ncbi:hypothetical protein ACFSTH_20050 [Paenibacillus yanchengensis]|uniref:Galactose-1-phosphate uridylyltransferase n=1 Tax=Paenibacillus yanchengensis TaxID=2035833 RepID=A0ABW4YLU3_9BACL
MTILFDSYEEVSTFHDPMQAGQLIERPTEIRLDPLTKFSSRVLFDPGINFVSPNYSEQAAMTSGAKCPFCDENIWERTPKYPKNLLDLGRLQQDETVLFPNIFPYTKHNAVVRMTKQHYVTLVEWTSESIARSFTTAYDYLLKLALFDPSKPLYKTINWNYLPPSGGSILHPHLHVMASERPTNEQRIVTEAQQHYYATHQKTFFTQLLYEELRLNERYIGKHGEIDWLHAFAPKSHYDFIGLLPKQITERFWDDLANSMLRFFNYFQESGLASFNLTVFLSQEDDKATSNFIRIVPRFSTGILETSDMNVLNFLQQEYLSLKRPENTVKQLQSYFST